MFTPELSLIIARTLAHVGVARGILALSGLLLLIAEFLRESRGCGRDIDRE